MVGECARFGDWEADLVIGSGQKQALVTINERISLYSLIAHVAFKTAELVSEAMIAMLKPFSMCVHTLTTDNGREFAQHERIAAKLGADFYFAHPYSSWERGANENMNGLIRQFFPKKTAFESITPDEIELDIYRLNHRIVEKYILLLRKVMGGGIYQSNQKHFSKQVKTAGLLFQ